MKRWINRVVLRESCLLRVPDPLEQCDADVPDEVVEPVPAVLAVGDGHLQGCIICIRDASVPSTFSRRFQ